MPHIPAIKPTNLKMDPATELPEFEVRITMDTTKHIQALTADEAGDLAWEEALNNGEFVFEINSQEDDDGII